MPEQIQKRGIKDYLDSIVDEDGLRTEVTVTLTNKTLMRVAAYLVVTTVVSAIAVYMVRGVLTRNS